MADKRIDGYSAGFSTYCDLLDDVEEMELNSAWHSGIASEELGLEAVYPIEAEDRAYRYCMDPILTMETASESGTQLIMTAAGHPFLVRDTAFASIQETAKLSGSALGRMNPAAYSEVMNQGFKVARGSSLLLERYGKLSACHSGSESGYEVMPISRLLKATISECSARFGELEFESGYNSHSFTEAWWTLPDAQGRLIDAYQRALDEAGVISEYAVNFMPALHFYSSDTANSCATLTPVFLMDGNRAIQLVEGIKVKHTRKGQLNGLWGLPLYTELIRGIYARFEATAETIKRLAQITVYHPENCVISLCRRYSIPKRYGEPAREEVERYMCGSGTLCAHDVFLAMTLITAVAKDTGASKLTENNLEESLGKIATLSDWSEHDVGGTVSWKD